MKTIRHHFLVPVFIFLTVSLYAQYGGGRSSEYRYFSIKAGATHSTFNPQPGEFNYLFHKTPIGDMKMNPVETFIDYVPGYYAGFIYNYDFRNNNTGVAIGAEYVNYGLAAKYQTAEALFDMTQKHMVSKVSIPAYFKIGNSFYEKQNYLYLGMRYDRNLIHYKAEEVNWSSDIRLVDVTDDMLKNQTFTGILGYNYMFLNFEVNYVLGGFLNKEYSVFLYDGKVPVKPYENYPSGVLFFQTGVTVPLNSWSSRQLYLFEMWFKRIFR